MSEEKSEYLIDKASDADTGGEERRVFEDFLRQRGLKSTQARLQILDKVQRSTDRIVPRLRRLRLQDPELGGTRYRRPLERLANKYS